MGGKTCTNPSGGSSGENISQLLGTPSPKGWRFESCMYIDLKAGTWNTYLKWWGEYRHVFCTYSNHIGQHMAAIQLHAPSGAHTDKTTECTGHTAHNFFQNLKRGRRGCMTGFLIRRRVLYTNWDLAQSLKYGFQFLLTNQAWSRTVIRIGCKIAISLWVF